MWQNRVREDMATLKSAVFFVGQFAPQSLIVAFIDERRAQGHLFESVCRVQREQFLEIAARTYRSWKQPDQPVAARATTDAMMVDAVPYKASADVEYATAGLVALPT